MRSLTGLRGVAALLVVSVHVIALDPPGNAGETFLFHGYLWVDLFLVLSGFVLSSRYGAAFRQGPMVPVTGIFLRRRLARLWPLLAVTTLFTVGARQFGWTFGSPLWPWFWPLIANLLMVTAWTGQETINVPAWSVSAEWACCLLFPLLQAVVLGRRLWPAMVTLTVASLALDAMAVSHLEIPFRRGGLDIALHPAGLPVLRCLCSFAMGMVMWRLAQLAPVRRVVQWRGLELGLGVAIVALIAHRGTDVMVAVLFPPFVLCVSQQTGLLARALAGRVAYGLGVISYSIYLVQVPLVVLRLQATVTSWLRGVLGLPQDRFGQAMAFYLLLLPVSAMTWWLIERPARRVLEQYVQRSRRRLPRRSEPVSS